MVEACDAIYVCGIPYCSRHGGNKPRELQRRRERWYQAIGCEYPAHCHRSPMNVAHHPSHPQKRQWRCNPCEIAHCCRLGWAVQDADQRECAVEAEANLNAARPRKGSSNGEDTGNCNRKNNPQNGLEIQGNRSTQPNFLIPQAVNRWFGAEETD